MKRLILDFRMHTSSIFNSIGAQPTGYARQERGYDTENSSDTTCFKQVIDIKL